MGISDRFIGAVGEKSREVSDKLTQKYRDRIGEELSKKKSELDTVAAELAAREKAIAEREEKIGNYYFIPKSYIAVPAALILIIALYFGYQFLSAMFVNSSIPSNAVIGSHSSCVQRGIAYYKEIGSFPQLSTGEDADKKVEGMCTRSQGLAFGR